MEEPPEIANGEAYIMVSNHQSMLDVPIFGGLLMRTFPKYIAKTELGRWIPSVSLNLTRGGNALIDRNDARQAGGDAEGALPGEEEVLVLGNVLDIAGRKGLERDQLRGSGRAQPPEQAACRVLIAAEEDPIVGRAAAV